MSIHLFDESYHMKALMSQRQDLKDTNTDLPRSMLLHVRWPLNITCGCASPFPTHKATLPLDHIFNTHALRHAGPKLNLCVH